MPKHDKNNTEHSHETLFSEKTELQEPGKYKVVLHNDDYTPMEFVVEVLVDIFHKNHAEATQIMLNVHEKGIGICGIYSYEIAETKVARVHEVAEQFEYPLKASMENI